MEWLTKMRFRVIATDGDGTLLNDGRMSCTTAAALERARDANIILILVTGQTCDDLKTFPHLDLFHLVVAENGGVLLSPISGTELLLGKAPPQQLVHALQQLGLKKLQVGRSMISANIGDERRLSEVVKELAPDWRVIRNRHDAMVLPANIDKASGLATALNEINVPKSQVVAIGDAENDAAMLRLCGLGFAVSNAVSLLKDRAQVLTKGAAGQGFV